MLSKKQKTAIELLIEGDLTKTEIAENVKVSRKTLYNWLKNEDFTEELTERIRDRERMIKAKIGVLAYQAVLRQENILSESQDEKVVAVVAKDVLDRAGYDKTTMVNVSLNDSAGVILIPEVGDIE